MVRSEKGRMRFRRLPVPYVQQFLRDMLSIQPFRTKRFLPQSYLLKALTFGLPFHLSPSCESQQNDAEGGRTERDQEAATAWGNANDDKRPARLLQAWVCVRKGNAEVKCTSVEVRLREHNCAVDVSRRHYDRAVTAVTTHGVAARTAGDTTPCTSSTAERAGGITATTSSTTEATRSTYRSSTTCISPTAKAAGSITTCTSSTSEAVADASSDAWSVDSSKTTKAQCQLLYRGERILSRNKEIARSERLVWLPKSHTGVSTSERLVGRLVDSS